MGRLAEMPEIDVLLQNNSGATALYLPPQSGRRGRGADGDRHYAASKNRIHVIILSSLFLLTTYFSVPFVSVFEIITQEIYSITSHKR